MVGTVVVSLRRSMTRLFASPFARTTMATMFETSGQLQHGVSTQPRCLTTRVCDFRSE